ncbi:Hsp20/alpha crystallin family protein [Bacillus sp. 31A1R]|uniref:Hsp20/alpha crystallin family protein n=1 Tax=Robertmurraya mangrovi TaxID=3098077 RepID=A0ABU5J1E8_9BACI|nr:Hsp20/alpha crystallin family protein [Bacillus sp. 31A1R]MDZ5473214.1 Hsp20/alpha crystallin family protein [Bacillus sp. 31A1R]
MSKNLSNGPNKRDRNEPFGDLIRTMNDFFQEKPVKGILQSIDEFFKTPFPPISSFPLDVVEMENEHIVTAELPGIKRENIHIDVLGNYLTISVKNGEIITEEDDINKTYRRKQTFQQMSRTVSLTHPINEKKVKASYQDGLLKVRIPKQKGKKIDILDQI